MCTQTSRTSAQGSDAIIVAPAKAASKAVDLLGAPDLAPALGLDGAMGFYVLLRELLNRWFSAMGSIRGISG